MGRNEDKRKDRPEALWKEADLLEGRQVQAMVVILRTTGCWWSRKKGCLMCSYNLASDQSITSEDLREQMAVAISKFDGEEMVKVYTSGSFLDEKEIPKAIRDEVLQAFITSKRILFESRPEFVSMEVLQSLPIDKIQLALGLESANDEVLEKSVRKGFRVSDYERAARLLNESKIPLRTYLLLKPPFLTERQALEDAIRSVSFASMYSESVSINPLNVQADTLVESLWRRGDYRPPWLWSLVEVLKRGKDLTSGVRIFSSPSGGGTSRGVHNCGKCDASIMTAIENFSFSQDPTELQELDCECKNRWRVIIESQDAMQTSVDIDRYLSDELPLD